jgi:hypothetical protein
LSFSTNEVLASIRSGYGRRLFDERGLCGQPQVEADSGVGAVVTYHHWSKFAVVAAAMSALQGCADGLSWINDRWGPPPVLSPGPTSDAARRQAAVVNQMIDLSGALPIGHDRPTTQDEWYTVISGGFNVIDDACQTYLDDLWKLDRERTTLTGVISATGAAVAAVVNPGGAGTATTLVVLAQAFGLAGTLTTNVANTYLYAKDPATVKGLVDKMMHAYRQDFSDKVYGNKSTTPALDPLEEKYYSIQSYPAAYYRMREYLSLCLPPTIDAQVQILLAGSPATPNAPPPPAPKKDAKKKAPGTTGGQTSLTVIRLGQ